MIRAIRGVRVMLDRDLAKIYGVPTKAFNQAVKRNRLRFPEDFMFRLTQKEVKALQVSRSQIVTLKRGRLASVVCGLVVRFSTLNTQLHVTPKRVGGGSTINFSVRFQLSVFRFLLSAAPAS